MLRKLTRHIAGGFAAGLFALGLVALVTVPVLTAHAQRSPAARLFPEQMTAYLRTTVNFNSCVYVSLTCSVKIGAVPYNSFLVRGYQQVVTTWNAGTSAAIALGTSAGSGNIVASQVLGAAGNGTALTMAAIGTGVTGNGIAQTGALGGFDIYATILIVGALPTAGSTVLVLEWIQPNDGTCAVVPAGATAPGC